MQRIATITLIFTAVLIQYSAIASTPVKGTLTATQTCDAYVSKNKRSNPDHTTLVVNKKYSIFESNKANNPDWFRIRIDNANPPERWVGKFCGDVKVQKDGTDNDNDHNGSCHTPGLQDSYVLALSWQPAFCETHRSKPECKIDDKKSYQARNFTLHGLWPNKSSCGTNYGFCGEVKDKPSDFCEYPALSLFTDTRRDLEAVMPSAAAGSCLQRHEWYKHGTCQSERSIDEYYEEAIDLLKQFNESGVAYYMAHNIGKTVTESAFINKVDCALGANAHKRIQIKCQAGKLVDVYINLPKTIISGQLIGDTMLQAQGEFKSNCGGQFEVDPIGFAQ